MFGKNQVNYWYRDATLEMQRSVLASLDQIFNDYYKPRLFKLSKTLVNQISINSNSISNKKLNNWLELTNGNNTYSRDGAIVSKLVLVRSSILLIES